ncbi:MAG: hypothetical protein KF850_37480 [Labilithrix sp.]|nr:hypothetical protein [Labilithrix sp.]
MNSPLPIARSLPGLVRDDELRLRHVRALVGLFALYAGALVVVMLLSDGADIGCILAGIAGHVLYATAKTAVAWREASWIEAARARRLCRRLTA